MPRPPTGRQIATTLRAPPFKSFLNSSELWIFLCPLLFVPRGERTSGLDGARLECYSALIQVHRSGDQLPLRFDRSWGGARKGAGRPRGQNKVPHRARPVHKTRHPLHVTVRMRGSLPSLREDALAKEVVATIAASHRDSFRVLHYSVQDNHLHLIVEADDAASLARGMQRLNSRVARRVNGMIGIRGALWRERYDARALTSPRIVRNVIVYVLMNGKKHGHSFENGIDALSSAPFFDGLVGGARSSEPSPVRAPRTWLAGVGWRRHGLIRTDERPAGFRT